MVKLPNVVLLICVFVVTLSVVACQPIRPEAVGANPQCSEAEKLALLPTFAEALQKGDAEAAAALFLPDATFAFDVGPRLDPATGKYIVPSRVETLGREQYFGVFQAIVSLGAGIYIENSVAQGDQVTAVGGVVGPEAYSFGTPAIDARAEFSITVQDCKIASYDAHYPETMLVELPAKAAALAQTCADDYKVALFKQFVYGLGNGDAILAGLPFAPNAELHLAGLPRWDETGQAYVIDPTTDRTYRGAIEIEQAIGDLLSQEFYAYFESDAPVVADQTVSIAATSGSTAYAELPVQELPGNFTVTINEDCQLASVSFEYTDATLSHLKEAKKNQ